ncbi:MAG TPA: hypothetical protein VFY71_18050 [Planctomycetota bacterium]|nr:hypothetical protein [Planctomycetota bacterium]
MGRWAGVLLLACALLPFATTRDFPFVHDDHDLRGPGSLSADPRADVGLLLRADVFGSVERPWGQSGFWRPAVLALFRAEWWLTDGVPVAHAWLAHVVNLLLHLLATYGLARLLMALGWQPALAAGAAALFGASPVHVESVAWASGHGDPGSAACGFLAAALLVGGRRPRDELLAAGLLLLALLFKESGALLLGLAAALAWCTGQPLRRAFRAPVVASLVYVALRAALFHEGHDATAWTGPAEASQRWLTWLSILPDVVRLSLWPGAATPLHPVAAATGWSSPGVAPGLAVLLLLVGLTSLAATRRVPAALLAVLALLGTAFLLAPFTRVPLGFRELAAPLAERHLYVAALAGPVALGAALRRRAEGAPAATLAAAALLALPLGLAARGRCVAFSSDEAFARTALQVAPDSADLWNHLGVALLEQYRDGNAPAGVQALDAFDQALQRAPGELRPALNRFIMLALLGRQDDAAGDARRLLQHFPDEPGVLDNVAHWHMGSGRPREAASLLQRELATGRALPGAEAALSECLHALQAQQPQPPAPPAGAGAEGGT